MRWRTRTSCLPLAANSGQYFATGASTSSSPRSTSISAARLVTVLVEDQTLVMVSCDPRDRAGLVAEAAPHVDDDVPVDVQHERRAQFLARVEVPRQRAAHRLEPLVATPVNVRHGSSSSPLRGSALAG